MHHCFLCDEFKLGDTAVKKIIIKIKKLVNLPLVYMVVFEFCSFPVHLLLFSFESSNSCSMYSVQVL